MSQVMNLTNKLYQEFALDRIKNIDWNDSSSVYPLVIELDPTSVCDLACPGCINEDVVNKTNSFSNEKLIELGNEFIQCGVKAVILIGGGEPLTHPNIGNLISLLGENDINIGITTNGTFIDKYIDQISEYSQWTRVSVDAGGDSIFKQVRPTKGGRSKFNKVINNMRMLAKIKKGKLGFSFLIQTEADGPNVVSNIDDIYEAAKLAKDIGCDYFEVKPSYQWREGRDHTLMRHDEKLMGKAKVIIDSLEKLEDHAFKILKAINLENSLNGAEVHQQKSYNKCPSTFLRTSVTPSGVYMCPYWRGKKHMKIGDVNEVNFQDMWESKRRISIMNNIDISKTCDSIHCLRHETNKNILDINNKQNNGAPIKSVTEFDRFI